MHAHKKKTVFVSLKNANILIIVPVGNLPPVAKKYSTLKPSKYVLKKTYIEIVLQGTKPPGG